MENKNYNPLDQLSDIRQLMERSSRFISLSGLSGVFAGIYAIIGAGAAYWYLRINIAKRVRYDYIIENGGIKIDFLAFFILDAGSVLLLALLPLQAEFQLPIHILKVLQLIWLKMWLTMV